MHPLGMTHPHPCSDVRTIGRAVDNRTVRLSIVENSGYVVDDLFDGDSLRRQIGSGVVTSGHPDPAMLDHEDVECRAGQAGGASYGTAGSRPSRDRPG